VQTTPPTDSSAHSPSKLEAQIGALGDLRWASLAGAVVTLELLALTIPGIFDPSAAFVASFSVNAAFSAPPPWNQILSPSPPTSSALGWAIVSSLILFGAIFGSVGFAYLYSAYRRVRRAVDESLLPGVRRIEWAMWCLVGAVLMVVLYLITLASTFAFLASPLTGASSPQAFIAGIRLDLAGAGAILALWLVVFVVLITSVFHIVSGIAAPEGNRAVSRRALDLMIVGSLFYFGIVVTPFWNPAPFTATLDFFGSHSPEMDLLTLPAWLLLSAGSLVLARAYGRDLSGLPSSLSMLPASVGTTAMGPVDAGSATTSTHGPWARRSVFNNRAVAVTMAIGVALLVYAAPSTGSSFGELGHWGCVPGKLIANETVWYPVAIIDAPYEGNATGTVAQIDPSGNGWSTESSTATNGNTTVEAVLGDWNISTARTVLLSGAGADAKCNAPFLTQMATGEGQARATLGLAKPSNETDQGLPTDLNLSPLAPFGGTAESAVFNASYTLPNMGQYENCPGVSGTFLQWSAYSESVQFQIPFTWNGTPERADVTLPDLTSYTYSTSATGVFYVEDLQGEPNSFGSGLAFDHEPCS
jgi:hypothetical protein